MSGKMSLSKFERNLEFLYELQSIFEEYDDIEIDLEEIPSKNNIKYFNLKK